MPILSMFGSTVDSAATYSPLGVIEMLNKVSYVKPLADGVLWVELANGVCGEFDVKPYMNSEFFSALKNPEYFQKAQLFFAGVGWPEGQDLGPDTIAAELQQGVEA